MTRRAAAIWMACGCVMVAGCQPAPPPPRVPVPQDYRDEGAVKSYEPLRPLARDVGPGADRLPPPMYDDVPLITQAPPEQAEFVQAYRAVGGPRIVVFVNRTVEGAVIPVREPRPLVGVEVRREATGAVDVERRSTAEASGRLSDSFEQRDDRFRAEGPATLTETVQSFLPPGEYDEVQAKQIDYAAIENVLMDWLGANGQVTLVSPDLARQRLTDEQVRELESGRPVALRELAERLDADVLVQAQARPTRQTAEGLEVRLLVEAMNTRGGESLARAFVDVPPPLAKQQINKYTRFVARKLMLQMGEAWQQMPAGRPAPTTRTGQ